MGGMYGPFRLRVPWKDPDVIILMVAKVVFCPRVSVLSRAIRADVYMLYLFRRSFTCNDSRVGRDLYRTTVLAPDDVTLAFTVRLSLPHSTEFVSRAAHFRVAAFTVADFTSVFLAGERFQEVSADPVV
jgi:hypothetical protein